jgi:nucleoside-diphosphate-sugar epimerase
MMPDLFRPIRARLLTADDLVRAVRLRLSGPAGVGGARSSGLMPAILLFNRRWGQWPDGAGQPLPDGWRVTTDPRAARTAAAIVTRPSMPTGPLNRVADKGRARRRLGWEPRVPFAEGLRRTIAWYCATHEPAQVRRLLREGGPFARRVGDG